MFQERIEALFHIGHSRMLLSRCYNVCHHRPIPRVNILGCLNLLAGNITRTVLKNIVRSGQHVRI